MKSKILITGGTGYIGSHTAVELMNSGLHVVIVDNLCNSSIGVLGRIEELAGKNFTFIKADVRSEAALDQLFSDHDIESVMHFAGLKAVGESVSSPIHYFDNNVGGTLSLIKAMERANLRRLVFSSSATVYGDPDHVPISESSKLQATNPYGRTKLMSEDILRDLQASDKRWHVAILRYFNPVGAHISGRIGEQPSGIPNNLMPYITQVATGRRKILSIFGDDYPTPDGTGVRDYIHVVDLAQGHQAALRFLLDHQECITVNLGTGMGVSVKQLVEIFSTVNGVQVPYQFAPRRQGDVAICYADPSLAKEKLNWSAKLDIGSMCIDAWRWQISNPEGY